jgi:hypothetical protein
MNIKFGELLLRWIGENQWEVYKGFEVIVNGNKLVVPEGFKTDLTSIPSVLWPMLSPMGSYTPAAVFHDYLYCVQPCSKEKADTMFLEGMVSLEVDKDIRNMIYAAVDNFGQSAWDEHTAHHKVGTITDVPGKEKA